MAHGGRYRPRKSLYGPGPSPSTPAGARKGHLDVLELSLPSSPTQSGPTQLVLLSTTTLGTHGTLRKSLTKVSIDTYNFCNSQQILIN